MKRNPGRLVLVVLAVLAVMALPGAAGAIDGTVLITQNTVLAAGGFPYKITQPGSYRLASNLTVPNASTTAIQITADHVTLDLNGFAILGPVTCAFSSADGKTTCPGAGTGVGVQAGVISQFAVTGPEGTSVRNGTVRGMGSTGILLASGIVESVQAWSNGGTGIIAFNRALVGRCFSNSNGNAGIVANQGTVTSNTVLRNGGSGIAGNGLIVAQNSVVANGGFGLELLGDSGYLANTLAVNNGGSGVQAAGGVNLGQNVCNAAPCP